MEYNAADLELDILFLHQRVQELEGENIKLKNSNEHMKSLLNQMQTDIFAKRKHIPNQLTQQKWAYYKENKTNIDILAKVKEQYNLVDNVIPWQLVKKETDSYFMKNLTNN